MSLRLTRLAAWALVVAIVFVTLGPIRDRPSLSRDPQIERFAAFLTLGFVFAMAYPRSRAQVALGMVACAFGLEAAQHLTADRHGEIRDALAKSVGGVFGVLAADTVHSLARSPPSRT